MARAVVMALKLVQWDRTGNVVMRKGTWRLSKRPSQRPTSPPTSFFTRVEPRSCGQPGRALAGQADVRLCTPAIHPLGGRRRVAAGAGGR